MDIIFLLTYIINLLISPGSICPEMRKKWSENNYGLFLQNLHPFSCSQGEIGISAHKVQDLTCVFSKREKMLSIVCCHCRATFRRKSSRKNDNHIPNLKSFLDFHSKIKFF